MPALMTVATLFVPALSGAAQAQGFFDALRGIFSSPRPPPPPVQRILPPQLFENSPRAPEALPEERGPQAAYCVRLCDGRYFPLRSNAGAPASSPEKLCAAMCPAAQTRIFHGADISDAAASDGQSYSSITNAFLYREKQVENCSCTGSGPTGLANLSFENDPTLRPGDVVVTRDGPMVFTGDPRIPHSSKEFRPAENYRGLPRSIRRDLSNMRIGKDSRVSSDDAPRGQSLSRDDIGRRGSAVPAR